MRINLWLLLLMPFSAAGIYAVLNYAKPLPDQSDALHISQARASVGDSFNNDEAQTLTLPHDWRTHNWHTGDEDSTQVWYDIEVALDVPPNRLWGILIPDIEQNAEVYINGAIAGGYGTMAPYPSRYSNQALYFPIANGLLRPDQNQLQIRVKSYPPGRGYLGKVYLGPDELLRPFYQRLVFLKSDLLWFFVAVAVGMMLIILALAWLRPEESLYRWFGAQIACWALSCTLFGLVDTPFSGPWHIALAAISSTWFCMTSFAFAFRIVDTPHAGLERLALICASVTSISVVVVAVLAPERIYQLAPFSTLVQMAIGPFVMLWVLRSFWRTRDAETFILIYTAGILMFFGYFSMSESTGFRASVEGRYLYYATPLFVAAFVFILVNRFIAALNETEALNRNLELRALQKNAELQANYERIREMEQAQTLAAERERIMRDMHDGVGGLLVSTLHRIESNGHEPVGDSGIAASLNSALTDLRLMVDSLEIGEEDLDVALGMLRRRLEHQLQSTGIKMIWQVDALPTVSGMTPHRVLQIMRILQEGITNAIRHACPTQLSLRAYSAAENVVIELADNGVGLPADINKGQGIDNMYRRAKDINATLTLNASSPGTRLSLTIPTEAAPSSIVHH